MYGFRPFFPMQLIPTAYAAATFLSTMLGGAFALRFSHWMDRIMAFSGGVLLSAGLLDLLPEAIALNTRAPHATVQAHDVFTPLGYTVVGFVLFYLVERMAILRSYHSHHHHPYRWGAGSAAPDDSHEDTEHSIDQTSKREDEAPISRVRQVGVLGAAGLCIHSLLDGFSIGVAYHASPTLGALVAGAVIAHDFSDGVSTVTLLLSARNSRSTSLAWLFVDAIAPVAGVALASFLSLSDRSLGDLLGWFAGMFVYLGATHMLPEAHAISDSWQTVAWTLAGIVLVFFFTCAG